MEEKDDTTEAIKLIKDSLTEFHGAMHAIKR